MMSKEMQIKEALARLEEGKFCFRMSDAIASHIAAQSTQIDALTALNNQDRFGIMQRDLHIHLLEKEVANLKGILMGGFKMRNLASQAIEAATLAKEKILVIGAPLLEKSIAEAKAQLVVFGERAGQMSEKSWSDLQPRMREFVKLLEKFTTDLFSKFKTAG